MFSRIHLSLSVATLSLISACAVAPVQTLSDARQTLTAAQAAGAAESVPALYGQANDELHRAEEELKLGDYREAARQAHLARRDARKALMASQAASPATR